MSHRLALHAEPGEHIDLTIENTLTLANRMGQPVEMVHNDRRVLVKPGESAAYIHREWEQLGDTTQARQATGGVWVAHYTDMIVGAIFATEVECLRYSLANGTAATWWPFGKDAHEVTTS